MRYFKVNYLGNRAPIDIGHHFSMWNGGIYWRAIKRFAKKVCHLPEVICGTYTDLAEFLWHKKPETLNAYQNGSFPKMDPGSLKRGLVSKVNLEASGFRWAEEELTEAEIKSLESQVCPPGSHEDDGVLEKIVSDEGQYL